MATERPDRLREHGNDVRRIHGMISESQRWGRGLDGEAVALLERLGFEPFAETPQPQGATAREEYDLILHREAFEAARAED